MFKLGLMALKLIQKGCVVIGRLLYGLKFEGTENIPSSGACIIVVNHPGVIGSIFRRHPILARRKLETLAGFTAKYGFRSLHRFSIMPLVEGAVEVLYDYRHDYRLGGQSAAGLWRAQELLDRGKAICFAPEGEATWNGRLQPLMPGASWLALRAHVPVVPVVAVGAYDILPRWTKWPRLSGKVIVRVGQPFFVSDGPCAQITKEMLQEASQKIWKEMAALLAKGV